MNKITFDINNQQVLELMQPEHDDRVFVTRVRPNGSYENTYTISNGEFVMLLNLYRYIKENDIQNDFINPYGKKVSE